MRPAGIIIFSARGLEWSTAEHRPEGRKNNDAQGPHFPFPPETRLSNDILTGLLRLVQHRSLFFEKIRFKQKLHQIFENKGQK